MELTHTATRDGRLSSFLKDEMKMSTGLMNRLKWDEYPSGIIHFAFACFKGGILLTFMHKRVIFCGFCQNFIVQLFCSYFVHAKFRFSARVIYSDNCSAVMTCLFL